MVARTVALGVGLLSGVATSQLPALLQQFGQRMGGALDGLRPIIRGLDDEARLLRALFDLIESDRRSKILFYPHHLIDPRGAPVG